MVVFVFRVTLNANGKAVEFKCRVAKSVKLFYKIVMRKLLPYCTGGDPNLINQILKNSKFGLISLDRRLCQFRVFITVIL